MVVRTSRMRCRRPPWCRSAAGASLHFGFLTPLAHPCQPWTVGSCVLLALCTAPASIEPSLPPPPQYALLSSCYCFFCHAAAGEISREEFEKQSASAPQALELSQAYQEVRQRELVLIKTLTQLPSSALLLLHHAPPFARNTLDPGAAARDKEQGPFVASRPPATDVLFAFPPLRCRPPFVLSVVVLARGRRRRARNSTIGCFIVTSCKTTSPKPARTSSSTPTPPQKTLRPASGARPPSAPCSRGQPAGRALQHLRR